jgi:hypothetical protein
MEHLTLGLRAALCANKLDATGIRTTACTDLHRVIGCRAPNGMWRPIGR